MEHQYSSSLGWIVVVLELDILELEMRERITGVGLGMGFRQTLETWRMAEWSRWPVSEYYAPPRQRHAR